MTYSCKSNFDIAKRHYRNGIYFHLNKRRNDAESGNVNMVRSKVEGVLKPVKNGTIFPNESIENTKKVHSYRLNSLIQKGESPRQLYHCLVHAPAVRPLKFAQGYGRNNNNFGIYFLAVLCIGIPVLLYIFVPGARIAILVTLGVLLLLAIIFIIVAFSQYTENH